MKTTANFCVERPMINHTKKTFIDYDSLRISFENPSLIFLNNYMNNCMKKQKKKRNFTSIKCISNLITEKINFDQT